MFQTLLLIFPTELFNNAYQNVAALLYPLFNNLLLFKVKVESVYVYYARSSDSASQVSLFHRHSSPLPLLLVVLSNHKDNTPESE